MNTYRVMKIVSFPELKIGEEKTGSYSFTIPGFTEDTMTSIKYISKDYHGFEYFEVKHEIIIKDHGIAFGFIDGEPIRLDFSGYKKSFTVKIYLNREFEFAFFSESTPVVRDFIKKIKTDSEMRVKIEEIQLDLNKAASFVEEFRGAWFKGVSTRVSSSALFGADLKNEPLFDQLQLDGANLTSITVPFKNYHFQISTEAGISSAQKIHSIAEELQVITEVKTELIDKIIR